MRGVSDLTDGHAVDRMIADAEQIVGPVEILVNNAGGSGAKNLWTNTEPASWSSAYDRNVLAAVRVATRVLPGMRKARWGRIINISSLAGAMPSVTGPDYSASKAAMNAMTISLARTVAAEGITVNAISPGTIRSAKLEDSFRRLALERELGTPETPWQEIESAILPTVAQVPLGRVEALDEVAYAVAFLASSYAAYISGVNLRVDGGMSPSI